MVRVLVVALFISIAWSAIGMENLKDSLAKSSTQKLTVRLHSAGMFVYSGRIVTRNPVADVNFNYERKRWGYTLFKAQDLRDGSSDINFMLSGFYSNIKITKKLTVTPYLAFRFEQAMSVADKGSDAIFVFTTAYHIHDRWMIDHSSLFTNILLERKDFDWVNRIRLLYSYRHLDVGFMAYNNNNVFDQSNYVSGGINTAYSRIKISTHLMLSVGITGIAMMETSDETEFPKQNRVFFTLAATVH